MPNHVLALHPSSALALVGDSDLSSEGLDEVEKVGIQNAARVDSLEKDLRQAYRRIEKLEEKVDHLRAKIVQVSTITAIAAPLFSGLALRVFKNL